MIRLILILLLSAAAIPSFAIPISRAVPFEIGRLNRTYEDLVDHLDPWEQGGVTVNLSSPHHSLTLFEHRIWIRASPKGHLIVHVDFAFEASGDVIADLEMGQISQRFEDHLVAPRQERTLRGEIYLEGVQGGYRITTLRLPRYLAVRVESRLFDSLIETCRQLAAFPMIPLNCASFAKSLSTIEIELPAPGSTYLLQDTELAPDEKAFLENFLASRPSASHSSTSPGNRSPIQSPFFRP